MSAPDAVLRLIEKFADNRERYTAPDYNETQLRREFLDPFFVELGWDVANEERVAPQYRDVIHEDRIRGSSSSTAPDYAFTLSGTRKFYLEAKKPAVDLRSNPEPAYQLRRYGWSGKLPVSLLSDFEELAVYDCTKRPKRTDAAAVARLRLYSFEDYESKWEEIEGTFSKSAILRGAFDKFIDDRRKHRGTETVDDAFLGDIEKWRDEIARNLALRNPSLSVRDLNYAVQKIIDRIIFLRVCEDRGTEEYRKLITLTNGSNVYARLIELFQAADDRYNSGLFHFREERGRTGHDELTTRLTLDDAVLKRILGSLYYPESPYDFRAMPADILGQVYERFLGKTIRLTAQHRAKVEEKPEVRKAGGVYYTPTYIVDYIVEQTVGRLLNGDDPDNPQPITVEAAARLRIVDPACGSGSFLIVAYQYLLDWHLEQYSVNPKTRAVDPNKAKPFTRGARARIAPRGDAYVLTLGERKRILLNNIFGVDIDSQAVEVTKLSLLLKVVEGEAVQSQIELLTTRQKAERVLPDLGNNIQCGNSLIGPDFYEQQELDLDEETQYRINVFSWEEAFPAVFKQGGFDAVIGNPPYIPIEQMLPEERSYYRDCFPELERKYDSSVIFVLSLLSKTTERGLLSYISTVAWQTGRNYGKFRRRLLGERRMVSVVNLPYDVFTDAYVDTCVYLLGKKGQSQYSFHSFRNKERISSIKVSNWKHVPYELVAADDPLLITDAYATSLYRKLVRVWKKKLGDTDVTVSTQGLSSSRFRRASSSGQQKLPFLVKGQAYRYLLVLDDVADVDMGEHQNLSKFYVEGDKIYIRRVISRSDRLSAVYYSSALVTKKDLNPFRVFGGRPYALYLLALINSKLISYLYMRTSSIANKDDFRQTTLGELRDLPIRPIDFDNPDDVAMHDQMVKLVETMLDLHKRLAAEKNPNTQRQLKNRIAGTDRQIDALVYKLYDLTEDEIALVEAQTPSAAP